MVYFSLQLSFFVSFFFLLSYVKSYFNHRGCNSKCMFSPVLSYLCSAMSLFDVEDIYTHNSASNEEEFLIKKILLTHDPDGSQLDSHLLLRAMEDIIVHATPVLVVCLLSLLVFMFFLMISFPMVLICIFLFIVFNSNSCSILFMVFLLHKLLNKMYLV